MRSVQLSGLRPSSTRTCVRSPTASPKAALRAGWTSGSSSRRLSASLDHDEGVEGAETRREWVERTYAATARLEAAPAERRIVVTHAGTANWVIAAWMRIPVEACAYAGFRVPSGSVTILEEDDRFHNRALTVLGSRSFLV